MSVFLEKAAPFAAGLLNGFLGTGGGVVLVLAFRSLEGVHKYRTALLTMLVLTACSAGSFLFRNPAAAKAALPYLLPGVLGGGCGGLLLGKLGSAFADRLFAILTVVAGAILLLRA